MPNPPESPLRVASLLPAATEIVAALGATDRLVGVSHACDWPSEVRGRAILTRADVAADASSGEPRASSPSRTMKALAVHDVDVGALVASRPDVILTRDRCDECAVPFEAVRRAVDEAGLSATRIVSLRPTNLGGIWESIETVAEALGIAEHGSAVVAQLQRRVDAVAQRASRLPRRPRVLTIERLDPVTIGGTWMPELVQLAGGIPLGAQSGEAATVLDAQALRKLSPKPDVVVLGLRGLGIGDAVMQIETMKRLIGSVNWPASVDGEVYLCDGRAYFHRPGPRIVESLEILAACIHPFEFRDFATRHVLAFQRLGLRRMATAAR
jgi:iron complex transport system substrate-binding protein